MMVGKTCPGCLAREFDEKVAGESQSNPSLTVCGRCLTNAWFWKDSKGNFHTKIFSGPTLEPNDDHDGTLAGIRISDFCLAIQRAIDNAYKEYKGDKKAMRDLTRRLRRVRIGGEE